MDDRVEVLQQALMTAAVEDPSALTRALDTLRSTFPNVKFPVGNTPSEWAVFIARDPQLSTTRKAVIAALVTAGLLGGAWLLNERFFNDEAPAPSTASPDRGSLASERSSVPPALAAAMLTDDLAERRRAKTGDLSTVTVLGSNLDDPGSVIGVTRYVRARVDAMQRMGFNYRQLRALFDFFHDMDEDALRMYERTYLQK